jgi:hypothetical protein
LGDDAFQVVLPSGRDDLVALAFECRKKRAMDFGAGQHFCQQ